MTLIDFDKLASALGELDEPAVCTMVSHIVQEAPEQVFTALDALTRGMDIVGEKFDFSEYFIADLVFAGELFTAALDILRTAFPVEKNPTQKKVILATVEGDLHDIGKNIVRAVLQSKGMQVVDLGVNVSPAVIVNRTIEENAKVVALSAVLTYARESMERTVKALSAAGIRDRVTVVVGGTCIDETVAQRMIRADAYGKTPQHTAEICLAALEQTEP